VGELRFVPRPRAKAVEDPMDPWVAGRGPGGGTRRAGEVKPDALTLYLVRRNRTQNRTETGRLYILGVRFLPKPDEKPDETGRVRFPPK
jgi:hypothetical protein